ncbi:MAG: hypothetical protein Q4B01_05815 [Eubacteriales bacterium]|nr:hypothetical protein [Eubacteriales bacterium]
MKGSSMDVMVALFGAAAFLYFAFQLLVNKNVEAVQGRKKKPVKNKEEYCRQGGRLAVFMGIAFLGMAALMYVSLIAAVAELLITFLIFGILWKQMNAKYGEI